MAALGLIKPSPPPEVMTFSRVLGLFLPIHWLFIKTSKGKSSESFMDPFGKILVTRPKLSNMYSCRVCFKVLSFPEETGK